MEIDWPGVRARVEHLRDVEQRRRNETGSFEIRVFGSQLHAFGLAPHLDENEIAEAEGQFGIRLPDDYRAFLGEVAAGGAGPYYGLFPLARDGQGRWGWTGDGAELTEITSLAAPFAPTDVTRQLREHEAQQPDEDDDEDLERWQERAEEILWEPSRSVGALCLCHRGCALRKWLVVSGPRRGQIWDDSRVDGLDLGPDATAEGAPLTFGRWYLDWLETAEAKVLGTADRA
ncbi:SMI1/KNR4 family protein [Kineosporia sp. J2-2]|uniref:SMI1/KNR4 family protein n=1 Tax=Kineosporia corallincola TaxID=2835133 RepID=A0ABS5TC74_9ACTN|nr:SMI1/KNR4 family protein [Kineosporia corallincola]MBT0768443.1 SMI1/KNR4 family protein [Kineosporia corallincola]